MKVANVVSVRDLGPLSGRAGTAEAQAGEARVASLLRRYPDLGSAEQRELLQFVRGASRSQLRSAFLSHGLEPRLIAYQKENARALRRGWAAWTPLIMGLMLLTTLLSSFA